MKTINYCIASFEGLTTSRKNQVEQDNLHNHIVYLSKLIPTLKIPLTQITLIKPVCTTEKFPNYYRLEEWKKLLPNLVILGFDRPDLYSYGQWIYATEKFPNFDYYILIEDDYMFVHDDFTSILIDMFKNKINGPGYLVSLATSMHSLPFHASISNGIINKECLKFLKLSDFAFKVENRNISYRGATCQFIFSEIFLENKATITDFSKEYKALFWMSEYTKNFSPENTIETLLLPIQELYINPTAIEILNNKLKA